uniref:Uncharacterized protein n=1 Tax=Latimeria chalumnae TaxID=7897 RepID=H3A6C5_LATCH
SKMNLKSTTSEEVAAQKYELKSMLLKKHSENEQQQKTILRLKESNLQLNNIIKEQHINIYEQLNEKKLKESKITLELKEKKEQLQKNVQDLWTENSQLHTSVTDKSSQLALLEIQKKHLYHKITDLQRWNTKLKVAISEGDKQKDALKDIILNMKGANAKLKYKIVKLMEEKKTSETEESNIQVLTTKVKLEEKNNKMKGTIKELKDKIQKMEAAALNFEHLRHKLDSAEMQKKELTFKSLEMQKANSQLLAANRKLEEEKTKLKITIEEIQGENQQMKASLIDLEKLRYDSKEIATQNWRLALENSAIQEANTYLQAAKVKLEKENNQMKELNNLKHEIETTETQNKDFILNNTQLQKTKTQSLAAKGYLEETNEEECTDLEMFKHEQWALETKKEELKTVEMQKENMQLMTAKDKLEKENDKMKELRSEIKTLQSERTFMVKDSEEYEAEKENNAVNSEAKVIQDRSHQRDIFVTQPNNREAQYKAEGSQENETNNYLQTTSSNRNLPAPSEGEMHLNISRKTSELQKKKTFLEDETNKKNPQLELFNFNLHEKNIQKEVTRSKNKSLLTSDVKLVNESSKLQANAYCIKDTAEKTEESKMLQDCGLKISEGKNKKTEHKSLEIIAHDVHLQENKDYLQTQQPDLQSIKEDTKQLPKSCASRLQEYANEIVAKEPKNKNILPNMLKALQNNAEMHNTITSLNTATRKVEQKHNMLPGDSLKNSQLGTTVFDARDITYSHQIQTQNIQNTEPEKKKQLDTSDSQLQDNTNNIIAFHSQHNHSTTTTTTNNNNNHNNVLEELEKHSNDNLQKQAQDWQNDKQENYILTSKIREVQGSKAKQLIEQCEEKFKNLETSIADLKCVITEEQKESQNLKNEKKSENSSVKSINYQVLTNNQIQSPKQSEIRSEENLRLQIESQRKEFDTEKSKLENKIVELNSNIELLNKNVKNCEKEIKMRSKMNQLIHAAEEEKGQLELMMDELLQENTRLQHIINDHEERATVKVRETEEKMKTTKVQGEEKLNEKHFELMVPVSDIAKLQEIINVLQNRNNKLQETIEVYGADKALLEEALIHVDDELAEARSHFQKQERTLQIKLNAAKEMIRKLQSENDKLVNNELQLQRNLTKLGEQRLLLLDMIPCKKGYSVNEIKSHEPDNTRMEHTKESLQQSVRELSDTNNKLQSEIKKLKENIFSLHGKEEGKWACRDTVKDKNKETSIRESKNKSNLVADISDSQVQVDSKTELWLKDKTKAGGMQEELKGSAAPDDQTKVGNVGTEEVKELQEENKRLKHDIQQHKEQSTFFQNTVSSLNEKLSEHINCSKVEENFINEKKITEQQNVLLQNTVNMLQKDNKKLVESQVTFENDNHLLNERISKLCQMLNENRQFSKREYESDQEEKKHEEQHNQIDLRVLNTANEPQETIQPFPDGSEDLQARVLELQEIANDLQEKCLLELELCKHDNRVMVEDQKDSSLQEKCKDYQVSNEKSILTIQNLEKEKQLLKETVLDLINKLCNEHKLFSCTESQTNNTEDQKAYSKQGIEELLQNNAYLNAIIFEENIGKNSMIYHQYEETDVQEMNNYRKLQDKLKEKVTLNSHTKAEITGVEEIKELQEKNYKLRINNHELKEQTTFLENMVRSLKEKLDKQINYNKNERAVEMLQENNEKLGQSLTNVDKDKHLLSARVSELQQKLTEFQHFNANITVKQVHEFKISPDKEQSSESIDVNVKMINTNIELQETVQTLKSANEDLQVKALELQETVNNLKSELRNLGNQLKVSDQNNTCLQEKCKHYSTRNLELQKSVGDISETITKEMSKNASLIETVKLLQMKNEESKLTIEELEKEKNILKDTVAELQQMQSSEHKPPIDKTNHNEDEKVFLKSGIKENNVSIHQHLHEESKQSDGQQELNNCTELQDKLKGINTLDDKTKVEVKEANKIKGLQEENKNLQIVIQKLKQQNAFFENQVFTLQEKLEKQTNYNKDEDSLINQKRITEEKNSLLQKAVTILQDNNEKLLESHIILEKDNSLLNARISELQQKLNEMCENNEKSKQTLEELERENTEVKETKNLQDEIKKLKSNNQELKEQMTFFENLAFSLKAKLDQQINNKNENNQNKKINLEEENKNVETQSFINGNEDLQANILELQETVQSLKEQKHLLELQFYNSDSQEKSKSTRMTEIIKLLQISNEKSQLTIEVLEKEKKKTKDTISDLQDKVGDEQKLYGNTEGTPEIKELQQENMKLKINVQELKEQKTIFENAVKILQENNRENYVLKAKISELQQKPTELQHLYINDKQVNENVNVLTNENEDLQAEISELLTQLAKNEDVMNNSPNHSEKNIDSQKSYQQKVVLTITERGSLKVLEEENRLLKSTILDLQTNL